MKKATATVEMLRAARSAYLKIVAALVAVYGTLEGVQICKLNFTSSNKKSLKLKNYVHSWRRIYVDSRAPKASVKLPQWLRERRKVSTSILFESTLYQGHV